MKVKCPNPECGKEFSVKGHANGTKNARELSLKQMHASIAKMTKDLDAMKKIFKEAQQKDKETKAAAKKKQSTTVAKKSSSKKK